MQKKGAKIEIRSSKAADERYLPLTLLTKIDPEMPIKQEVIFSLLLPVISYHTLEEALEPINSRSKPLALYIVQ